MEKTKCSNSKQNLSFADKLKLKDSEAKRMERLKTSQKKEKKTPEEIEKEIEEAKYFETAIPCEAGSTTFLEMNFSRQIMKARVLINF